MKIFTFFARAFYYHALQAICNESKKHHYHHTFYTLMELTILPDKTNQRTAMVVDDTHDIVEVFCDLLQILQINVVGRAYDGKEAVEVYQKCRPELVILDVYMPKYDGFYALEKIREINPSSLIMMVTAGSFSKTQEKLRSVKPTILVHKPTDTTKILNIVSGLLANFSPEK